MKEAKQRGTRGWWESEIHKASLQKGKLGLQEAALTPPSEQAEPSFHEGCFSPWSSFGM